MRVTGFGYGGAGGGSTAARNVEAAIGSGVNAIRADLRRVTPRSGWIQHPNQYRRCAPPSTYVYE
jgi:hypothetical protein